IGTAGTCGTDSTVDWLVKITKECLFELGHTARIAALKCEQSCKGIIRSFEQGDIDALPAAPSISGADIAMCTHIVALAGAEQISKALDTGADVVVAGRTTDTAIIAALPIQKGMHPGAAWHGAKIGECGALCATNPQSGVLMVEFDQRGFTVHPMAEGAHATPHTVSAHMLYENSDPFILHEPGGHLDVTRARYVALDDTRVRVEGSEWHASDTYTVKLEGARIAGYQTVLMATVRDRRYVAQAQSWIGDILAKHASKVADRMGLSEDTFSVELRLLGMDATLGPLESGDATPNEVGVLCVVTAETQEVANEIGKLMNPYLLHHPLTKEEEQPTFSFPFSPAEIDRGPAFEFCLHHVLRLADPMEAFRLEVIDA
ncbi:MAG: acyclic terpene utilization AtuA family protein, partial [Pseudomonadota bacterium]